MKIGIDLDGVVIDSETTFRTYEEIFDIDILNGNNLINREEPKFQARYNWTKEQEKEFIEKYFLKISKESNLMSGFMATYELLKQQGNEFVVITARGGFIKEMKDYSKDIVKEIKNSDSKFKHDNLTKNRCPECGKYMLEVKGKRGKMLVCEDRECNTRKTVSQITNSRCPVCHKKLELRGEGEAKTFICSCGHREKLSAYNKRKQEDKNKASKKDINKYLKSQNKDVENFNNPFAQALAKLKK